MQTLFLDEILYVSSWGNYIDIHMSQYKETLRMSLLQIIEKLPEEQFFKIHKKYIVNLSHVHQITLNEVKIGSEMLPVSRRNIKTFRERWSHYKSQNT